MSSPPAPRVEATVVIGACCAAVLGGVLWLRSVQTAAANAANGVAAMVVMEQRLQESAGRFEADLQRMLRTSQHALSDDTSDRMIDTALTDTAALLRDVGSAQRSADWVAAAEPLETLRQLLLRNDERLQHLAALREAGTLPGVALGRDLAADMPQAISALEQARLEAVSMAGQRATEARQRQAALQRIELLASVLILLVVAGCMVWLHRSVLRPLRELDAGLRLAAERGEPPLALSRGGAQLRRIDARIRAAVRAAEDRAAARIALLRDELDAQRARRLEAERACQAAEQSSRSRSDYVASLGHALRTPLNGMLGLIDLLAVDVGGEQGQRRLQSVRAAGAMLRAVLDQMTEVPTARLAHLQGADAAPASQAASMQAAATVRERQLEAQGCGARVLVAEDHAINQAVITEMLQHLGHTVEVVPDGRRAVQSVRDQLFDVVLMDWSMPEMDGVEATRLIRAEESQSGRPRVPIIALTAHTYAENRRECLDAGMDDFLPKPITMDVLDAAIRRAVA